MIRVPPIRPGPTPRSATPTTEPRAEPRGPARRRTIAGGGRGRPPSATPDGSSSCRTHRPEHAQSRPRLRRPPGRRLHHPRHRGFRRPWIRRLLRRYWATESILSRGKIHDAVHCAGLAAFQRRRAGRPDHLRDRDGDECEIITHNSLADSGGIGSCLLAAVRNEARATDCKRLWLVTTNDNTPRSASTSAATSTSAPSTRTRSRRPEMLKPEIPDEGLDGIRVRHEIELEYVLWPRCGGSRGRGGGQCTATCSCSACGSGP
jgi:hypothetical protein